MHAYWAALGIVVLAAGLADVFLTTLNYDEAGLVAVRLCALQWHCFRRVVRRLPRAWRTFALRQVIGLNIVLNMTFWLVTVAVGYGLIFYSQMYGANFRFSGQDLGAGLFSAMYFSAAQLATVGTSQISPETDLLRSLSIIETLTGLGLITLIITFLFGVYQVVHDLRALASRFVTAGQGIDDPLAGLGPYFAQSDVACLDNQLRSISENFWSYTDGLRQHPLAYYFQSGRDQFSLPYVLHMLGHWLAALRWGVPSDHPMTEQPLVRQLSFQFEQFGIYLQAQFGATGARTPEPVPFERFMAANHAGAVESDQWLNRFLLLNRDMARLTRHELPVLRREAYRRYEQWLSFAWKAEQITAAVSRDLDYRPLLYRSQQASCTAAPPPADLAVRMAEDASCCTTKTRHAPAIAPL